MVKTDIYCYINAQISFGILTSGNFKLATFEKVFPGAFFSALGWVVFSYIFSIYVDSFSGMSYMYGSFTAVIVFMLWIYFLIYIMFIGAEINKLLFPETEATVTVKM